MPNLPKLRTKSTLTSHLNFPILAPTLPKVRTKATVSY